MESRMHGITFYESNHDFESAIGSFLIAGLSNNYKFLYLMPEKDVASLRSVILSRKQTVEGLVREKAIEIIDPRRAYLSNGSFDPERQVKFLEDFALKALEEGFNGLCVAGEGTALLDSAIPLCKTIRYEAAVNDLIEKLPIIANCLYNPSRMDQKSVLEISRLHPYVHRTGEFSMNEDYYSLSRKSVEFGGASRLDICRGTADSLLRLFRIKSIYVENHEKNVSDLAIAIADEMSLDSFTKACLEMAGKIHDIGMNSLFLDMISRPGPLHSFEKVLLREHPSTGFEISKGVPLPEEVSNAILHHHERVDGSGYPNGLKGSEISLEGSIIAVSEVVAAMSFYRPYREKYGTEYALSEIITNCGSLYRTEVAEACSNVFSKGFAFDSDS